MSRSVLRVVCFVLAFALPTSVLGAIDAGTDWLESRVDSDGAITSPAPTATDFQQGAAAVEALVVAKRDQSNTTASLRDNLQGLAKPTTARLARVIISGAAQDASTAAEWEAQLRERQGRDGAFGDRQGYTGSVLDTALALRALAVAGAGTGDADVRSAVGFLLDRQGDSGAWAQADNEAAVYPTALAVRGLQPFRALDGVDPALDAARDWLLDQRNSGGSFGTPYQTASALLAIAPNADSKDLYADSVSALRAAQRDNGSWADDAFSTGLAIQALVLASKPQPNPDIGTIGGTVVSAQTGAGVEGARVELSGTASDAVTTGSDGTFLFNDLEAGDYTVTVNADDFQTVQGEIRLDEGEKADLGQFELVASDSTEAGTLRGTVTNADTGEAIPGATVTLPDRDRTTRTASDGSYQLTGVAPGTVTIEVTADGFAPSSQQVDVAQNTVTLVSPALTPESAQTVAVAGTVTDNATGDPIAGATVRIDGDDTATTTTDSDGTYRVTGLATGELTLEADADGFRAKTATIAADAGTKLDFSPALQPSDQPPEEDDGAGLRGVVVDSVERNAVEGATVTLSVDGDTQTTTTDKEGRFQFGDLTPSTVTIEIAADNFQTRSGEVDLAAGVIADVGRITLQPTDPDADARVIGRAVAAGTGDPIPSASVTVDGDGTQQSTTADSEGRFELEGLAAERVAIEVNASGFETARIGATLRPGMTLDLGDVRLRPTEAEAIRPDLRIQAIDDSGVTIDPQSFAVSGEATLAIANAGNQDVNTSFRVEAFFDKDGDGERDRESEPLLGSAEVDDAVAADGEPVERTLALDGAVPFRDAPITFRVDPGNTVIELDESNNTASTAAVCDEGAPVSVDLATCLDGSGSVGGGNFSLQTDGIASAIEDPDVVPRDGSVRLTMIQFNSFSRVEVEPTRITDDNVDSLAQRIRDIGFRSGGTDIAGCIATARDTLSSAEPASSTQVIDVSTDGRSNQSAAERESERARDAGIDALNAIGVTNGIDRGLLEAIVFPRPVGGSNGFVVEVDEFEQFGEAIADKIRRETAVPDPTVGGLEIADGGTDEPVTLSAVVGNAGQGQTPDDLELVFFAGDPDDDATELARVSVPQFATGDSQRLRAEVDDLDDAERVVAQLANSDSIAQCSEANDRIERTVSTALGTIDVTTDRTSYTADERVAVEGVVSNDGSLPGQFDTRYAVLDDGGDVAARLRRFDDVRVAAGDQATQQTSWPTGQTVTGSYSIRARLFAADGESIDEATAGFSIEASGEGGDDPPSGDLSELITLRTQPDAAEYHVNDRVELGNLVRNLSVNAVVEDARLSVNVIAPDATTVFEGDIDVAALQPGGRFERDVAFALTGAATGDYSVDAELRSDAGALLATARDGFAVVNDPAESIDGSVSASASEVFIGESVTCTETVSNNVDIPVDDLELRSIVADIERGTEMASSQRTVSLAGEGERQDARSVDTIGFDTNRHACILQARIDGEWQALDRATFQVKEPPIELSGDFEALERGQLLVLLDRGKRQRCDGASGIEFHAADWSLGEVRQAELELVSGDGHVIDAERVEAGTTGAIDRSTGGRGNLAITQAEQGARTIRVTADDGSPGADWSLRARIWRGDGLEHVEREKLGDCADAAHDERTASDGPGFRVRRYLHAGPGRPDPFGPAGAPTLAEQRAFLEQFLADEGWAYRIVESADAFKHELRSGDYAAYALFNERIKLDNVVQRELREAVYRGAGLLFAGPHDRRNNFVFGATGADPRGRVPGTDGLAFRTGPLASAGENTGFAVEEKPRRLCAPSADIAATYTGVPGDGQPSTSSKPEQSAGGGNGNQAGAGKGNGSGGGSADGPAQGSCRDSFAESVAATTNEFGDGRAVLTGFDALAEAATSDADRIERLLRDALAWTHPDPVSPVAGTVRGFRIRVTNERFPTPGRVRVRVPDAATVVAADGAERNADGELVWSFDLDRGETFERAIWLRLPQSPQSLALEAVVESNFIDSNRFIERARFSRDVDVVERPNLAAAREAAEQAGGRLTGIARQLEQAERLLERGRLEQALRRLTVVADQLRRLRGHDPAAVRRPLAFAIANAARRWFDSQAKD